MLQQETKSDHGAGILKHGSTAVLGAIVAVQQIPEQVQTVKTTALAICCSHHIGSTGPAVPDPCWPFQARLIRTCMWDRLQSSTVVDKNPQFFRPTLN